MPENSPAGSYLDHRSTPLLVVAHSLPEVDAVASLGALHVDPAVAVARRGELGVPLTCDSVHELHHLIRLSGGEREPQQLDLASLTRVAVAEQLALEQRCRLVWQQESREEGVERAVRVGRFDLLAIEALLGLELDVRELDATWSVLVVDQLLDERVKGFRLEVRESLPVLLQRQQRALATHCELTRTAPSRCRRPPSLRFRRVR